MDKQEWDGEGLPPAGCECYAVWLEPPDGGSRGFEPVTFKGQYTGPNGCTQVWFCTLAGEEIVLPEGACSFRPIRRAAQKAEDEAVGAMWAAWERGDRKGGRPQTMREIYTAIRDGRIPGVKLEHQPCPTTYS